MYIALDDQNVELHQDDPMTGLRLVAARGQYQFIHSDLSPEWLFHTLLPPFVLFLKLNVRGWSVYRSVNLTIPYLASQVRTASTQTGEPSRQDRDRLKHTRAHTPLALTCKLMILYQIYPAMCRSSEGWRGDANPRVFGTSQRTSHKKKGKRNCHLDAILHL